ncbi:MAG: chorismate mutase [Candidatus Marinimicrobia bacterium]|jgi:chorismate mutase|nr:chorismate mutase [Candidatus Neomarinimicrobiota bacterium]MBT5956536.1 chorismate mutase [Candidatus Neomarinimicrobiota bacterium]MBT6870688.1 chorismate mutase [Candidatus Neomarinimicrobiota bacterium]MBT7377519.1 chorismate mutase [Candidatus Neomarinimicrobiota bacterium]|tara:strand:+ start:6947 stop:7207 length:261 start_codon:yes stop_codon:yes gene_type:complete
MDKRILNLRVEIDEIDAKIITLLKSRMDVSRKVGELKAALHIPVEDKGREEEIIQRLGELADRNLKEEQLIRIFTAVFKSSKQIQK